VSTRPLCRCHGEPKVKNGTYQVSSGEWRTDWRCGVKNNERNRERFARFSGYEYNRHLLRTRRNKSMWRRRQRQEG
jgi:hypothetical protein